MFKSKTSKVQKYIIINQIFNIIITVGRFGNKIITEGNQNKIFTLSS